MLAIHKESRPTRQHTADSFGLAQSPNNLFNNFRQDLQDEQDLKFGFRQVLVNFYPVDPVNPVKSLFAPVQKTDRGRVKQ